MITTIGEILKILFYNHTGQVSGAERVMLMILSGLDRNRFQTFVVCPKDGDLTKLAEDVGVQVSNVELLEARFTWRPDLLIKYLKSFFGVIAKLRKVLLDHDPDLIHANTIRAGIVATTATLGTGIRVVWHLHDMLPHHPLSTLIRWYATLSTRTSLLAVSQAVAIRFQGSFLRLLNACQKVQVIHNGIDLRRFNGSSALGHNFRNEFELGEEQFVVGIVGQITPRKGQLGLIRAFAAAQSQIQSAVLLIVGAPLFNNDHEYLLELKRTAAKLGIADRVIFVGSRQDIPSVMEALDLLVLNSTIEPLGLVILEAMACRTAVLATDVDGVPEIISHEVSGWLVPSKKEDRLAEAIVALGRDLELRNRLAENAIQNVVPRFSAEKYLTRIENYYHQIYKPSNARTNERLVQES